MADQDRQSKDEPSARDASRANSEQSCPDAHGAGSARSAGSADNPQDGSDTGVAGASRPRGKTEDPDITL